MNDADDRCCDRSLDPVDNWPALKESCSYGVASALKSGPFSPSEYNIRILGVCDNFEDITARTGLALQFQEMQTRNYLPQFPACGNVRNSRVVSARYCEPIREFLQRISGQV